MAKEWNFVGRQSGNADTTAAALTDVPLASNAVRSDGGKASEIAYRFVSTAGEIFLQQGSDAYSEASYETSIDASSSEKTHGPIAIAGAPNYVVASTTTAYVVEIYVR